MKSLRRVAHHSRAAYHESWDLFHSNLVALLRQLSDAMSKLLFSSIEVTRQAFYRSAQAFAIVNLKPIVPGRWLYLITRNHVLTSYHLQMY